MIVWGGSKGPGDGIQILTDGAAYNPASNTWRPISSAGAPSPRYQHFATWTGSQMLIWGGVQVYDGWKTAPGGAGYDPVTDTWTPIMDILSPKPEITGNPQDKTVVVGQSATLSVAAQGANPLTYQWRFGTNDIPGATHPTYSIANTRLSDAGTYSVVVKNDFGVIDSREAQLSVFPVGMPYSSKVTNYETAVKLEPSLISRYSFNDGTVADHIGNRNGTLMGNAGPDYGFGGGPDLGLKLDGNGWVNLGYAFGCCTLKGGGVTNLGTIELWLRPAWTNIAYNPTIISQRDDKGGPADFSVHMGSDADKIYFWDGYQAVSVPLPSRADSVWHHLGVIADSGIWSVVWDGQLLAGVPFSISGRYFPVQFGSAGPDGQEVWVGNLDEIAIYSTPLTTDTIREHYLAGLSSGAPLFPGGPTNTAVEYGKSITLGVDVLGTVPFAYQWFHETNAITGATNALLTISQATLSDAGNYTVVASNSFGVGRSPIVTLTINPAPPPQISRQPRNRTALEGGSATFTTAGTGAGPIVYQWYFETNLIPGATSNVLDLSHVKITDAGSYTAVVGNLFGSVTSSPAQLYVLPASASSVPELVKAYQGAVRAESGLSSFITFDDGTSVDTVGKSDAVLMGDTDFAYGFGGGTDGALSLHGAGWASMPWTNNYYTGGAIELWVKADDWGFPSYSPTIVSDYIDYGSQIKFSLALNSDKNALTLHTETGDHPLALPKNAGNIWHHLGISFGNFSWNIVWDNVLFQRSYFEDLIATSRLKLGALKEDGTNPWKGELDDVAVYRTAQNPQDFLDRFATFFTHSPPQIDRQPVDQTVTWGDPASLDVTADGIGSLTVQWYHGTNLIVGATNWSYPIGATTFKDGGTYHAIVSNSNGLTATRTATLVVKPGDPPNIQNPPQNLTIVVGAYARLSVSAWVPGGPIFYQWMKDGYPVEGATNNLLPFPNVSFSDSGSYAVSVSNQWGSNTSDVVQLAVILGSPYHFTTLGRGSLRFGSPAGLVLDAAGNLYVSDSASNTISKVSKDGSVVLIAGAPNGEAGNADGLGTTARFNSPKGLAIDSSGNLFVADYYNAEIRMISTNGVVSTLTGTNSWFSRFNFLDGPPSTATLRGPCGLGFDSVGHLFFTDTRNNAVRFVDPLGNVTTPFGTQRWYEGIGLTLQGGWADGSGADVQFQFPSGLAADSLTNVYVGDAQNNVIRKIVPAGTNWLVSTFAGMPTQPGMSDGQGSMARFGGTAGLATDSQGNLFVADNVNNTIRMVSPNGYVTTIGGMTLLDEYYQVVGGSGNVDGTGLEARFNMPQAIAVDAFGTLYVADSGNGSIRVGVPAVPSPWLSQITLTNGNVLLQLLGLPSTTYVLQASPTPVSGWFPTSTNMTASDGRLTFTNPLPSDRAGRFYRASGP